MAISSRELCQQAGLSYRQLDHWTRSAVLVPSDSAATPGSGSSRIWADTEPAVAAVLVALRDLGCPLETLRRVAAQLRDAPADRWHGPIYIDPEGQISREPCQVCWRVDLDVVARLLPLAV